MIAVGELYASEDCCLCAAAPELMYDELMHSSAGVIVHKWS